MTLRQYKAKERKRQKEFQKKYPGSKSVITPSRLEKVYEWEYGK